MFRFGCKKFYDSKHKNKTIFCARPCAEDDDDVDDHNMDWEGKANGIVSILFAIKAVKGVCLNYGILAWSYVSTFKRRQS